jgi:hypothetical protein
MSLAFSLNSPVSHILVVCSFVYYITSCSFLLQSLREDSNLGFIMTAVGVTVPRTAHQHQLKGTQFKEAKGRWVWPSQESASECVPEVCCLLFSCNLDNQIYLLIAKLMPLLVTRS